MDHVLLPIDARDIGGGVVALVVGPGASCSELLATLSHAVPELAGVLHELLAVDGVFLQDEVGQVWEQTPSDPGMSQWVAVRRDHRLLQQMRGPLFPVMADDTTSTTTAVAAQSAVEPSVVFVLVGGGTLLRLAPQRLSQLNLAASLTDLLMLLAIHGCLPNEPVVTVAAAMPRAASTPNTLYVGFVVVDLPDVDREVAVLQDQSLDGSLLVGLTVDRGTQAEGLLAPAQARRGFTAALNGAPMQGTRRSLVTGDLIQLHQGPLAARVWSATYLFQVLPELRLFALPTRLPGLRSFVRGDMSFDSRWNTRNYLFEAIGLRLLEQCLELGEPGARSHPYLVLGPAHLPLLLYVPSDDVPSQEQVMRFLFYSGFFDPGTTFAITTATSGTVPIVVSIPPRAHLLTVLFPAPDETPTMLQLSVDADCRLDSLQLPIRRGMELVFPRLTHAAVIQECHSTGASSSSRGGGSMSLLQVKATIKKPAASAPAAAQPPVRDDVRPAKADGRFAGACVVPTPFGRRQLPSARLPDHVASEEPNCTAQDASGHLPTEGAPARLMLHDLLPAPASGLGFGLTPDMLDFLLHEHVLSALPQHLPPLPDLEPCSVDGWGCLPIWDRLSHIQALYLFTDGSFFPGSTCAGWAVVALGLCQNRVVRLGFCHGTCVGTSAYDGELRALAHARAIALASRPVSTVVASDCLSALQVAFGKRVSRIRMILLGPWPDLLWHLLLLDKLSPRFMCVLTLAAPTMASRMP